MYLGQVCIDVATLQWGKFVYLGRVCKCGESSVIRWHSHGSNSQHWELNGTLDNFSLIPKFFQKS